MSALPASAIRDSANPPRARLVVGQSGGPTSVINASLVGVIHEALTSSSITDVLGAIQGVEGILSGKLVDLRREDPGALEVLRTTPSAALGSNRYKLRPQDPERLLEALIRLDVRYFLYVGGNDSADTTHQLALAAADRGYDLRAISVPKTIDNDLPLTDHTPGFGSIARYLALAARDAGRDAEAMRKTDPVKLLEVPGRDAGWVAAATALARQSDLDAPHLIFPPERPLNLDRFLDSIQRAYDRRGFVVATIAETVHDDSGRPVGAPARELGQADAFGHNRLTGAAANLCLEISDRLGLRARWDKPGTLSRTSLVCASEVDLAEAYEAGRAGVRAALAGESDRMVTFEREPGAEYRISTGLAPLAEVANRVRHLPDSAISPDGTTLSPAFVAYALPLLGAPLPEYARLRGVPFVPASLPAEA